MNPAAPPPPARPSAGRNTPPWLWPRAAYLHVPFCAHHCGYCDFAVVTGADDRIDAYLDALESELALLLGAPQPVETIFIGGGTPTYLSARQLERLLGMVSRWLPPSSPLSRLCGRGDGGEGLRESPLTPIPSPAKPGEGGEVREFSIESTPDSLSPDKVAVLADHGVTRVSIGVQSFRPETLAVLERRHTPADAPRAVECVRRRIDNVSLDLIFGVPGQALADWDADLRAALALAPDHVSTYGLTYEKGTPLWRQRRRGLLQVLDEDAELALYLHALDTLAAAGYRRYEVSNHARSGRECRHNQTYWANWAYFGFGVGAARYVEGRRELNTRSLANYLSRLRLRERSATIQSETLGPEERARETISTQLRRAEGIGRASFREQTGFDLDALTGPKLARHVATGLLHDDGAGVALTRTGVCVADSLIADLL